MGYLTDYKLKDLFSSRALQEPSRAIRAEHGPLIIIAPISSPSLSPAFHSGQMGTFLLTTRAHEPPTLYARHRDLRSACGREVAWVQRRRQVRAEDIRAQELGMRWDAHDQYHQKQVISFVKAFHHV